MRLLTRCLLYYMQKRKIVGNKSVVGWTTVDEGSGTISAQQHLIDIGGGRATLVGLGGLQWW